MALLSASDSSTVLDLDLATYLRRGCVFMLRAPLNLLYLDPDVKYIPTEGKAHAWDKLKGSETAQQESEMDDSDIMAANIETENIAVASKILAAMKKQAPGLELASVKPSTRSTTKKVAGKKALPILDTVIPNFPGRLVRHPTEPKANLAGLVLRAVVVSRTAKGRYIVQISGSVPEKGGYRDHDDLPGHSNGLEEEHYSLPYCTEMKPSFYVKPS